MTNKNLRAGNSLISFLSESLVFCQKVSEWAIRSKKWAIRSFLVSDLSDSLTISNFLWATWANSLRSLIFGERPERIAQGCSVLVSNLSDSLTSLRGNEWPWANGSGCSLNMSEWANGSCFLAKTEWFTQKTDEQFPNSAGIRFPPSPQKICLVELHTYNWRRNPYRTMCYFITFKLKQTFFLNN